MVGQKCVAVIHDVDHERARFIVAQFQIDRFVDTVTSKNDDLNRVRKQTTELLSASADLYEATRRAVVQTVIEKTPRGKLVQFSRTSPAAGPRIPNRSPLTCRAPEQTRFRPTAVL
jgi:hypothetical protein